MALVDQNVVDGPAIQVGGTHRGIVEFTFSDGAVVRRNVRALNAKEWANVLVDLPAEVIAQKASDDAADGVSADAEIVAHKSATAEQRAVAYLRSAMATENAYDAYLLLDKFNDYRIAKGWTLNQVASELARAGLASDEWGRIKVAYQYLSASGRPATMATAKTIQANWDTR